MSKVKLLLVSTVFSLMSLLSVATPILAAPCEPGNEILGLPTWYKYLEGETDGTGRCVPQIPDTNATLPIGIAVLELLLRLAGIVAAIFIIYGAFQYMLSQGEPDKAKGAKTTVTNALIGLVITLIAIQVIGYLGTRLGN